MKNSARSTRTTSELRGYTPPAGNATVSAPQSVVLSASVVASVTLSIWTRCPCAVSLMRIQSSAENCAVLATVSDACAAA